MNLERIAWLLPVFLFAVSQTSHPDVIRTVLTGVALFGLLLPSAQLYRAYVTNPNHTQKLKWVTLTMQLLVLALSLAAGFGEWMLTMVFIAAIRAYNAPAILLRQYAIIRLFMIMVFAGGFLFVIAQYGIGTPELISDGFAIQATSLLMGALMAVFLLGESPADGYGNITHRVGLKFTFRMVAVLLLFALVFLAMHFYANRQLMHFYLFLLFFSPVGAFYFWLARHAPKQPHLVNPKMVNLFCRVAAIAMGAFSLLVLLLNHLN